MKANSFIDTLLCLYHGQSLVRIRMNNAFRDYTLRGAVLDVGGGRSPDYFSFFTKEPDITVRSIDGSTDAIDFETDKLPIDDSTIDTVILANVLEHIYNHQFLLTQIKRILRAEGQLLGFVPFWINYHPDPHDYFRYTKEALSRMLIDAEFTNIHIKPIAVGPFLANFNTIVLSFPRILRPLLYVPYAILDFIFLRIRPSAGDRTPLGFVFTAMS